MIEKNYYVYIHINKLNNKTYIGITSQNPKIRWNNGYGYFNQKKFYNAILKYGWDNFEHKIIFSGLTKEEAEMKEIELIKVYKSNQQEYGYNIANGGNCVGTCSEITKQKISNANKGRIITDEAKMKMSKSKIGNTWNVGKECSKETREKISKANKGKQVTVETRKKISESHKGKKIPEETKRKISKALKGRNFSDEHRKKLSIANKGKKITQEQKLLISKTLGGKKIKQYDMDMNLIKNWDYLSQIHNEKGFASSNIYKCCNGERKTAYGYKWEYEKEVI